MQFKLDKINETEDYFIVEICERKTKSKKPSENIAMFDYADKNLFVLSATTIFFFCYCYW